MKLQNLEINYIDLYKAQQEETLLFAKCGRTGKELRFTLLGTVRIYLNGKILAEFVDLSKAVEFFNNIN